MAQHVHVSQDVTERLTELHNAIQNHRRSQISHSVVQVEGQSASGLVSQIKERMPHAGYRLIKGTLEAQGHRQQWNRVKAAMYWIVLGFSQE